MRDLLDDLDRWRRQGVGVAIARVVDLDGSGPRLPGAAMAVNERGEVVGSVSGGCVEGAVVTEALEVLKTGERKVVVRLQRRRGVRGRADVRRHHPPVPGAPGLVSGALYDELAAAVRADRPVALATVIAGPRAGRQAAGPAGRRPPGRSATPTSTGWWPATPWASWRRARPRAPLRRARRGPRGGGGRVRGELRPAAAGWCSAPSTSAALVRVAKVLGYRVTVCDAREVFATRARFRRPTRWWSTGPTGCWAASGRR